MPSAPEANKSVSAKSRGGKGMLALLMFRAALSCATLVSGIFGCDTSPLKSKSGK